MNEIEEIPNIEISLHRIQKHLDRIASLIGEGVSFQINGF